MLFPPIEPGIVDAFQIIGDLSVIVAIAVAWLSFNQWRRELVGRSRFELARKVVMLTYKIQNNFGLVRSRVTIMRDVLQAHRDGHSELSEEGAVKNRLTALLEPLEELRIAGWEASIVFPKGIDEHIKYLFTMRDDLERYADQYYHDEDYPGLAEPGAEFFYNRMGHDDFQARLDESVDIISKEMGKYTH